MAKEDKTNVMRILTAAKINFEAFSYSAELTEGTLVADILGESRDLVFKTLVTESDKKEYFVFVIPVESTLDLKAAARTVNVKSLAMLKQKDLLPLTGYIHGGCSPIGMKKAFTTVFHNSAEKLDFFYVSAGRTGRQIKVNPKELCQYVKGSFCDVTVK